MKFMKRQKAFTIVELVVVIAVASILFAIITGLAVLTRGVVVSQKATTSSLQEYQVAKNSVEKFMNDYSNENYCIELATENQVEIYILDELENEDACVAKLIFDSETKKIITYSLDESNELVEDNSINFTQINNVVFTINEESNLLKINITFEKFDSYEFLVNLGGTKIGNLY